MNKQQAIDLALMILDQGRKGQFVKATWASQQKPARQYKGTELNRTTQSVVRLGIDYSNIGRVKDGIASGERPEVGPLPFGSRWILFPFVLESSTGKTLFRIYQTPDAELKTTFFVDGEEVDEKRYIQYLTPSDCKALSERNNRVCFSVDVENLTVI